MNIVEEAEKFARYHYKEIGRMRRYTGEPYIRHTEEVVKIVGATPNHSDKMLAAAWLHDITRDTSLTMSNIYGCFFDTGVASIVCELNDRSTPEDGNRAQRKKIDRDNMYHTSTESKTIKLACIIDTVRGMPAWNTDFTKIFLGETRMLLRPLKSGDPTLWHRAFEIANQPIGEGQ